MSIEGAKKGIILVKVFTSDLTGYLVYTDNNTHKLPFSLTTDQ